MRLCQGEELTQCIREPEPGSDYCREHREHATRLSIRLHVTRPDLVDADGLKYTKKKVLPP
jgi:hypothetical protein